MRMVVLDASAIGGGAVSRATECAAREAELTGTLVDSVRLYSLFGSCCVSCGLCCSTGRCTARTDAIRSASERLASAELLLVGVASSVSQRDPRAQALLRRLVASFAGETQTRGGGVSRAVAGKRAAMLSTAPPLLGIPAALGALPYGLGSVWKVLDRAGVDVVGCTSIARSWSGPSARDQSAKRAARLGRLLTARPATVSPTAELSPAARPGIA